MNEYYNIINIFVSSGLLLGLGLMLLFMVIPESPLLGNYRKARYSLAGAYLFYFAVNIMEYLSYSPEGQCVPLLQTATLAIATSQALLFTFAMLALLEVRFPGWRYIFREAIPALALIVIIFTSYICLDEETFKVAFYVSVGIYIMLLLRYTYLFLVSYRHFRSLMDNYFSDFEAEHLRWVAVSFFAALTIGIMALISTVFMSTLVAVSFSVVFDVFYAIFAIRFINYAYQFHIIERAMDNESLIVKTQFIASLQDENDKIAAIHDDIFVMLEKRMEEWVEEKGFTKKGITIEALASLFSTNSKYISIYLNSYQGKTFREWVNELRIEEAKVLLLESPSIPIYEIAFRVGFVTQSHFGKQFLAQTGCSPVNWRMKNKLS